MAPPAARSVRARNHVWPLLLSLTACGRVGIELIPSESSSTRDDGGSERDDGAVDGAIDAGCARPCQNAHGSTQCRQGRCAPTCAVGYADCDGDPANGCEAAKSSCAECALPCRNDHGSTLCTAGVCTPSCDPGFADCDGNGQNGCETNIASDPESCGTCTRACDPSSEVCVAGSCEPSPCSAGRGECDDDPRTSCETDLTSSVAHCGFCGGTCSNAHGTVSCSDAVCTPACASGYGDCDGSAQNGCEQPLDSANHCGMCGRSCPANGGTASCSAGVCTTSCNVSGTFALKGSIPTTWPSSTLLSAGSGTFVIWSKLQLTQSANGNSISGTLTPCEQTVPDFAAAPAINERYGLTYPTATFDRTPALASTPTSGTLSALAPGSAFTLARSAFLFGATLPSPVGDAWPSAGRLNQVDSDGDGKPGITASYKGGALYTLPPTNNFATARAVRPYMAARVVFALSGTLTSCTQSSGTLTAQDIDSHTLGCRLLSGRDCDASDTDHLDSNTPDYRTSTGSYTLIRVADSASCADVRAAAP